MRTGAAIVTASQPLNYPRDLERDVVSDAGTRYHLRPIRPEDAPRLVDFHHHLSPRSIYLRFFSFHPELSTAEVERFTRVDYVHRLALVAEVDDRLIAVGRFDRKPGETEAEVAFVVADEYQHHGIGTLLLDELVKAARERGITTFRAETLCENRTMLDVFHHAGFPVTSSDRVRDGHSPLSHRGKRRDTERRWPSAKPRAESKVMRPATAKRERTGMTLIVAGPTGTVEHDGGAFHPEQQSRIFAVMDGVRDLGLGDEIVCPPTPKAEMDDLARVHSARLPERAGGILCQGWGRYRPGYLRQGGLVECGSSCRGGRVGGARAPWKSGEKVWPSCPVRPPGPPRGT